MISKKNKKIKEMYRTGQYTTKELAEQFENKNGDPVSQRYIQMVLYDEKDIKRLGRTSHLKIFSPLDVMRMIKHPEELEKLLNSRYREYYVKRTAREIKFDPNHWKHDIRRKQLRATIMARDDYKCVECGSSVALEVHHVKPARTHPNLEFDPDNCLTLCHLCHW